MAARVLVVEDDKTMAEVLIAYLDRAGHPAQWTADGGQGDADTAVIMLSARGVITIGRAGHRVARDDELAGPS